MVEVMSKKEGSPRRVIKAGAHVGKGIAVFTSGGDSQGKIPNIPGDVLSQYLIDGKFNIKE